MESFLTPILLSLVQKYVILRRQDAQLSLWEGDAAFQNLDLRLDVLQNELQLPFDFLSGHIHELIIHIPWTKITSEPITVTINTMEFVLKLKRTAILRKSAKSPLSNEEPPKGYIKTLVDKIFNNILITCNNIILKYIEDDIVVSMNIQLLSFCSADDNWKPAFIDIGQTKNAIRNRVQIQDLTICLDTRNSAGHIDICQEPILYKCSLEGRILRIHDNSTLSTQRLHMDFFTKQFDFNISSLQFLMIIRLMSIMMALDDIKFDIQSEENLATPTDNLGKTSKSMFSWVWNKVPSVLPGEERSEIHKNIKPVTTIGVYITQLQVTLKLFETNSETMAQTSRRIKYIPIAKMCLRGIYFEYYVNGVQWHSTRGGITQILAEYLYGDQNDNIFIEANSLSSAPYFTGSLFDVLPDDYIKQKRFAKLDYDVHLQEEKVANLFGRTSVAEFDMLRIVDIPVDDELEIGSHNHFEYRNFQEKLLIRIFVSSISAKYNAISLNVVNLLRDIMQNYDYSLHEVGNTIPIKLPPPLAEDYDALMNNISKMTVEITVIDCSLEIHPLTQPIYSISKMSFQKRPLHKQSVPFLLARIRHVKLQNISPLYENRLVYTTCQLPLKPNELLDACYSKLHGTVTSVCVFIVDDHELSIVEIPMVIILFKKLLLEKVWPAEIEKINAVVNIQDIFVKCTRPEAIIALRIFEASKIYMKTLINQLENSNARQDILTKAFDKVQISVSRLSVNFQKFQGLLNFGIIVGSIQAFSTYGEKKINETKCFDMKLPIFYGPKNATLSSNFINCKLQLSMESSSAPPALFLRIEDCVLIVSSELSNIMIYSEVIHDLGSKSLDHRLSRTTWPSDRFFKRTYQPNETIHTSSDKGECSEHETVETTNKDDSWNCSDNTLKQFNSLIFHVEVNSCEIIFPIEWKDKKIECPFDNICIEKLFSSFMTIRLPAIKIKTGSEHLQLNFPIQIQNKNGVENSGLSWFVDITELCVFIKENEKIEELLMPIKTTVTLAFEINHGSAIPKFILNLHVDTAEVIFNIYASKVPFLKRSLELVHLLLHTEYHGRFVNSSTCLEDEFIVEELVDIASYSGKRDVESITNIKIVSSVSLWLQWTCTKATVNLIGDNALIQSKIIIDMEDIMFSIDQQNVYFKHRCKIGTFNVEYFILDDENEWIATDDLKLSTQASSDETETEEIFLYLTFTVAEVENIFRKWGTDDHFDELSKLSELVLNIQSMQLQVTNTGIGTIHFYSKLLQFNNTQINSVNSVEEIHSSLLTRCVTDLPLVHLNCKGLIIYLPTEFFLDDCNVLILTIRKIKITPSVKNPLTRYPLRPDIYSKAEQLRILHIPGSKIEDRQYELSFCDISIVTSDWNKIVKNVKVSLPLS